jgi:hypothetical protein
LLPGNVLSSDAHSYGYWNTVGLYCSSVLSEFLLARWPTCVFVANGCDKEKALTVIMECLAVGTDGVQGIYHLSCLCG